MSLIWQFDTSVWYQSLHKENDQFILERYYKDRDINEYAILCNPANPKNCTPLRYPSHIDEYGTCFFDLAGSMPLLSLVTDPNPDEEALLEIFGKLGSTVSEFHEIEILEKYPQPANFRRLKKYITADSDDAAGYLLSHLDSSEMNALKDLIDTYSSSEEYVVHGGLGLGTMFVTSDNKLEIPTGPEAGVFTPMMDLAWIVGSLPNLNMQA